ncbi:MAG: energy-coupling factor transporter transmembrane component T family protein [Nocardioidaceae bacterium]
MRRLSLSAGPLSLLAGCLLPVAGAVVVRSAQVGLLVVLADVLALGWLVLDVGATLRRLALGAIAALSITATTWLYAGHRLDVAAGSGLRILCLVMPAALVSPLIRPSQLGDHLGQRLHLPARFVVGGIAALQRLDSVADQWAQVQRARRARGLGLDGGPVRRLRASGGSAFALLVVSMRQTALMALAMDARGFGGATRRSWAESAPWRSTDSVVLGIAVVLAVLPWLLPSVI